jgi:cobalt/nickel transport system permease protein
VLPLVVIIAASLPFITPGDPLITFHFYKPLTITETGLGNFSSVVTKALLAVIVMTLLTATTRFRDLIAGMQKLGFPMIFTSILGFIYRYIFFFIDEIEHLNIGRRSRSFGQRPMIEIKGFGWMISSLFVRSFERAERIYQAMCARGFTGKFQTMTEMQIKPQEVVLCIASILIITTIKLMGRYYG